MTDPAAMPASTALVPFFPIAPHRLLCHCLACLRPLEACRPRPLPATVPSGPATPLRPLRDILPCAEAQLASSCSVRCRSAAIDCSSGPCRPIQVSRGFCSKLNTTSCKFTKSSKYAGLGGLTLAALAELLLLLALSAARPALRAPTVALTAVS